MKTDNFSITQNVFLIKSTESALSRDYKTDVINAIYFYVSRFMLNCSKFNENAFESRNNKNRENGYMEP